MLPGHVPAVVAGLTPKGRLPATNHLYLAIGLPLRNQTALDELLRQLYDPHSTNFHKFLTTPELTARFGPTEPDYQAVIRFVEANGRRIIRILLAAGRCWQCVQRRAGVSRDVGVLTSTRRKRARSSRRMWSRRWTRRYPWLISEGLSDFSRPHPRLHRMDPAAVWVTLNITTCV